MRIVGLTGKARAGKDTTCQFIREWGNANGVEVRRFAFADALKESASRSLGVFSSTTADAVAFCDRIKHPHVKLTLRDEDSGEVLRTITGREYLQFYGTEGHREVFGDEFWVEALFERIEQRCQRFSGIVVVTDVRFENEAQAIRDRGGEVWEVIRGEHGDALKNGLEAHASEAGVPDNLVDATILNDGGLDALDREVRSTCVEHL